MEPGQSGSTAASNFQNLSKSITLPDRFDISSNLPASQNKSEHAISPTIGEATLVKIEDDDHHGDQNPPWRVETVLNCKREQVNHQNHFELTPLHAADPLEGEDRPRDPSDDGSSNTYPRESTSIVSKIRDILQRNMGGLWDPLKMDHHSLFTQLNVLCHFQDGSVAWKETARWLKYEEKVEMGGRWSKPHVSTASLHALLELRRAVKNKSCIVDLNVSCRSTSLLDFADDICDSIAVATDLSHSEVLSLRHILQQPHKHKHRRGSRRNKKDFDSSPSRDQLKERRKSLMKRDGKDYWSAYTTFQRGVKPCDLKPYKPNKRLMEKIPKNTETANILIGQVGFLKQPIVGIFRLRTPNVVEGLSEISLPTRFVVLIIGPLKGISISEHCELGRALAALFNDKVFCEVCYQAISRDDILCGIDEYLDNLTVLPPSIWDPAIRLEPPSSTRTKNKIWSRLNMMERHSVQDTTLSGVDDDHDESLVCTGRLFDGLSKDIQRKTRHYVSDFKDGLHVQCVASVVFLYFACITPIVTFGGLLGKKTDNYLGTMEMLMSGAICGTIYSLFAGQPLNIIGATGPLLVFESILYHLCKENAINFLSFRCWIGLWSFLYLLIMVALNLSSFVRYITRFTEESFAVLISLIFIIEAFSKIIEIWDSHPVRLHPDESSASIRLGCYCRPHPDFVGALGFSGGGDDGGGDYSKFSHFSQENSSNSDVVVDKILKLPEDCKTYREGIVVNSRCLDMEMCRSMNWSTSGSNCDDNFTRSIPDVFLLSFLLFFGTFSCAFTLRTLRNSPFFPTMIRNLLGDFAVLVSIVSMTVIDYFFGIDTPKLEVPNQFKPTLPHRGWVVNPLNVEHWWLILVAMFPGLLATILIALDQQITSVIINRREHKLKKGSGYHLDLLVLAFLVAICSLLGLPWFVAATVRAITHVKSLIKESSVRIPGERPQMLGVREQRLTGLCIHLLIGVSCLLTSVLKLIPMPVLYGVFLYMGITSLGNVQFIERVLIMFMPAKYQPDYIYLRHVKTFNVHIFTIIQITCSALMWTIKSIKTTSIGFPLVLVALIAARKGMDLLFSQRDLFWLDNLLPDERRRKEEDIQKMLQHQNAIFESQESHEHSNVFTDDEDNTDIKDMNVKNQPKENCSK